MSQFNSKLQGIGAWDRKGTSQNYHWADRNGRMYLCGCMPCFRVNGEVKYPAGRRFRSTKMMTLRRWS